MFKNKSKFAKMYMDTVSKAFFLNNSMWLIPTDRNNIMYRNKQCMVWKNSYEKKINFLNSKVTSKMVFKCICAVFENIQ